MEQFKVLSNWIWDVLSEKVTGAILPGSPLLFHGCKGIYTEHLDYRKKFRARTAAKCVAYGQSPPDLIFEDVSHVIFNERTGISRAGVRLVL